SCSRYATPRALHSSPTRRSSDLVPDVRGSDPLQEVQHPLAGRPERVKHLHLPKVLTPHAHRPIGAVELQSERQRLRPAPVIDVRSEEHTSELQSRENLVCRLLLE